MGVRGFLDGYFKGFEKSQDVFSINLQGVGELGPCKIGTNKRGFTYQLKVAKERDEASNQQTKSVTFREKISENNDNIIRQTRATKV